MSINACVKNMRNLSYLISVALIFKDKGGLAKHPLICHPRWVFGRQENERKGEKGRETGRGRENSRSSNCINDQFFSKSCMGLIYYPGQSKLQKCVNHPLLHEGNSGRKYKNQSNGSKSGEPVSQRCENSQPAKFSQVAKIRNLRNFRSPVPFFCCSIYSWFMLSFSSSF